MSRFKANDLPCDVCGGAVRHVPDCETLKPTEAELRKQEADEALLELAATAIAFGKCQGSVMEHEAFDQLKQEALKYFESVKRMRAQRG